MNWIENTISTSTLAGTPAGWREAITARHLAQGYNSHDRDSNPQSDQPPLLEFDVLNYSAMTTLWPLVARDIFLTCVLKLFKNYLEKFLLCYILPKITLSEITPRGPMGVEMATDDNTNLIYIDGLKLSNLTFIDINSELYKTQLGPKNTTTNFNC